ncbi:MAG: DUF503 domain-containing protein [Firmicutes bacterium]|nr:DUF503 domain-containing protein [Bacillota bacterium]
MIIGTVTVELYLGDIFSLKEKRQVVKSVIDRVRRRFNAAVAEVDRQDDHRWAVLGLACVANSTDHVNRQLDSILDFLDKDGRFSVESIHKELL